ncbi:MAG: hypothetical protein AMXMBFR7_15580 [Planctomycetota bacterium]
MNCEQCQEKLPDFLLDELPEHQAISVQEHLLHCAVCMARYRELKGTGKAMEAIPEYRNVSPTDQFKETVQTAARVESQKIIETLPAEKRERLRKRQAAQLAKMGASSTLATHRQASPWSGAVLAILVIGIAVASMILLYPGGPTRTPPLELGSLDRAVGEVQQFYAKAGQSWSQVQAGKVVQTYDEFATRDDGCARFALNGGGAVLLGPLTEVKFRPHEPEKQELLIQLTKGDLGLERPLSGSAGAGQGPREWQIATKSAAILPRPGARLYVKVEDRAEGEAVTVRAIKGQLSVSIDGGAPIAVDGGQELAWIEGGSAPAPKDGSLQPPAWRVDLLGAEELARYLAAPIKVLKRRPNGLEVELTYGFKAAGSLRDWKPAQGERRLVALSNGGISVPTEARFGLDAPLDAPLTIEMIVRKDTPKEASFAFGALDGDDSRVSVDLGREALLQIVKGSQRLRAAHVPYRKLPAENEKLILSVIPEGAETKAILQCNDQKTRDLALAPELLRPGKVWLSALDEGLVLEGLTVRGVLPRAWLLERLAEE